MSSQDFQHHLCARHRAPASKGFCGILTPCPHDLLDIDILVPFQRWEAEGSVQLAILPTSVTRGRQGSGELGETTSLSYW